jgi:ferredoxin
MTYLVTDNCIKCKHTDCVEVCPVDCFYEGENMLVINPDECIDCGVCEPECPVDAIVPDSLLDESELEKWTEINLKYSLIWPVLTQKKDSPEDAEQWNNVPNKFEDHFSEEAGTGD